MRKGYTLIELLIVMAVLAIASVNLVSSYGRSQERIEFQQKANEVVSAITAARASAISNSSGVDNPRVVTLSLGSDEINSFVDEDENFKYTSGADEEIKSVNLEDIAEIKAARVLRKVSSGDEITSKWVEVEAASIRFFFYPTSNTCNFSIEPDGDTSSDDMMLVLDINRPTDDPVRFLNFHKKSCIPEILSSPPTA